MKDKRAISAIALVSVMAALLAGSIAPASAWNFWRHHHNSPSYYYYRSQPSVVIGTPDFSVGAYWSSPQPGWHWHSNAWYYGHDEAWRAAHPYHPGPNGGFYLQF